MKSGRQIVQNLKQTRLTPCCYNCQNFDLVCGEPICSLFPEDAETPLLWPAIDFVCDEWKQCRKNVRRHDLVVPVPLKAITATEIINGHMKYLKKVDDDGMVGM